MTFTELHNKSVEYISNELADLKIYSKVSNVYPHHIGHPMGQDIQYVKKLLII